MAIVIFVERMPRFIFIETVILEEVKHFNNRIMQKSAPGWGKAIGIIIICLGGLGVFYQIYKILIPSIFSSFPMQMMNDAARLDPDFNRQQEIVLDQMNTMVKITAAGGQWMMIFGYLGIFITIFYIIGGAKLLTPKPQNYNFGKYALIAFIAYNVIEGIVLLSMNTGFLIRAMLTYSGIGLVFDVTLLIILLSSDKTAYGIGRDPELEQYTLHVEDDEII